MIVLFVILGLLLLFLLLLLLPCRIGLHLHEGNFTAELRYLIFRLPLLPLPEKAEKPQKQKEPKAPAAPEEKKKKAARRPFLDYIQLFNDALPDLQQSFRRILRHITLRQCRIRLTVAQEEAADTAIRYGRANLLLYNIYAFLAHHIRIREYRVQIDQDYTGGPEAETADLDLLFSLCPLAMTLAGFRLLWRGGMLYLDFKKQR